MGPQMVSETLNPETVKAASSQDPKEYVKEFAKCASNLGIYYKKLAQIIKKPKIVEASVAAIKTAAIENGMDKDAAGFMDTVNEYAGKAGDQMGEWYDQSADFLGGVGENVEDWYGGLDEDTKNALLGAMGGGVGGAGIGAAMGGLKGALGGGMAGAAAGGGAGYFGDEIRDSVLNVIGDSNLASNMSQVDLMAAMKQLGEGNIASGAGGLMGNPYIQGGVGGAGLAAMLQLLTKVKGGKGIPASAGAR